MSDILISIADAEQREACYRLIYEIFCSEMGILRGDADHESRIVRDEGVDVSYVLHAELNGCLAGTLGIIIGNEDGRPFPAHCEQEFEVPRFLPVVPRHLMAFNIRFLVKPEYRSSPLPFRMIVEASRIQIERNVQLVFCFCQPHLLNLYTSLGFRPYAPLFEVQGFGVVAPLVLIVPDLAHMRSIRSPLVRYLPKSIENVELAERIRALLPEETPVTCSTSLDSASWSEAFGLLSRPRTRTGPFQDFSNEEMAAFLERSQTLECTDGQHLIVKGQDTNPAFVVLDGAAEVRVQGTPIVRFEQGEMFGDFAMLLGTRRTADVYAAGTRSRFLVLDQRTLQRILTSRPELAAKFLLNLSRSLAIRLLARPA